MHICAMFIRLINALLLVHLCTATENYWQGNWFPGDPGANDTNNVVVESQMLNGDYRNTEATYFVTNTQKTEEGTYYDDRKQKKPNLKDAKHGIKMGISDPDCDDANRNVTIDWNGSPVDYTCFGQRFRVNRMIQPKLNCDNIPADFATLHYCMNRTISYNEEIPTYGHHRPLWAKYGEYKYLPKQRWLHNLEHGAIVMLYHPCTNQREVYKVKVILRNCMWKHVISASQALTPEYPIVLLSWGCRYLMNAMDAKEVINFIKSHGMQGPEKIYDQGFYKHGLIRPGVLITDKNDTYICPPNTTRIPK